MPLKLVKWRVLLESLRPYYHHLDLDGGILENSTPSGGLIPRWWVDEFGGFGVFFVDDI